MIGAFASARGPRSHGESYLPMSVRTTSQPARFARYAALLLTAVMVLFPPFTSLGGTEYAFVLTGPAWSQAMGAMGSDLGLEARLHWELLAVQLAMLWLTTLTFACLRTAPSERLYGLR